MVLYKNVIMAHTYFELFPYYYITVYVICIYLCLKRSIRSNMTIKIRSTNSKCMMSFHSMKCFYTIYVEKYVEIVNEVFLMKTLGRIIINEVLSMKNLLV